MIRSLRVGALAPITLAVVVAVAVPAAHAEIPNVELPGGKHVLTCDTQRDLVLDNSAPLTVGGATLTCSQFVSKRDRLVLLIGPTASGTPSKVDARSLTFGLQVVSDSPIVVHGSPFDDTIFIAGGRAYGYGGNDLLQAIPGTADSLLFGGAGDDAMSCGRFSPPISTKQCEVRGGDGNDRLQLDSPGKLFGEAGDDDLIIGIGAGAMALDGGTGRDTGFVHPVFTVVAGEDVWGKLDAAPGATPNSLIVNRFPIVSTMSNVEVANVFLSPRSNKVTMDNEIVFNLYGQSGSSPSGALGKVTVRVPGGVWTQTTESIAAPGLQPVNIPTGPNDPNVTFPIAPPTVIAA
jgi:hypothetical protein